MLAVRLAARHFTVYLVFYLDASGIEYWRTGEDQFSRQSFADLQDALEHYVSLVRTRAYMQLEDCTAVVLFAKSVPPLWNPAYWLPRMVGADAIAGKYGEHIMAEIGWHPFDGPDFAIQGVMSFEN